MFGYIIGQLKVKKYFFGVFFFPLHTYCAPKNILGFVALTSCGYFSCVTGTAGFVQVLLDIVAIHSSAYTSFSSGLAQHRQTLVLNI